MFSTMSYRWKWKLESKCFCEYSRFSCFVYIFSNTSVCSFEYYSLSGPILSELRHIYAFSTSDRRKGVAKKYGKHEPASSNNNKVNWAVGAMDGAATSGEGHQHTATAAAACKTARRSRELVGTPAPELHSAAQALSNVIPNVHVCTREAHNGHAAGLQRWVTCAVLQRFRHISVHASILLYFSLYCDLWFILTFALVKQ